MYEKTISETSGEIAVPVQYLIPLLQYLEIKPSALSHFFSLGQVSPTEEKSQAIAWWTSKTVEDQDRYLALLETLGKPEKINRLISVQYFDQIYIMNLFSGKNSPEDTVYSLALSPDGKHFLFDDSYSRIDFINAGIGFLDTGDLPRNLENAAIIMERDSFIALACIIDFLQKEKYSQAISDTEPFHTIALTDLKKFLSRLERLKDNRWLTVLILMSFPYSIDACSDLNWDRALTELHNLEFIVHSQNDKDIELTTSGMDFCYSVARSVKRLALIFLDNRNERSLLLNSCLFIRTWNRVWAITPDSSSDQVSLAAVEPITLFKLLDELIMPEKIILEGDLNNLKPLGISTLSSEQAETPEGIKVPYTCPFCHTPLPPTAKFCRKCGKPVHPDEGGE